MWIRFSPSHFSISLSLSTLLSLLHVGHSGAAHKTTGHSELEDEELERLQTLRKERQRLDVTTTEFRLNSRSFNDAKDSGFASSPSSIKIEKDGGGGVMTADGRTPERKVSELDLGEKRGMLEIGFRQLVLSSTPSAFPSTLYPQHSTLNTQHSIIRLQQQS